MLEQPLKSRTIKTVVQKGLATEKPPVIDFAMLLNQHTSIVKRLDRIEQQLDYMISLPQQPELAAPAKKNNTPEPVKSIPMWEQSDEERPKRIVQKADKKPSKGKLALVIVFLAIILLAGIYLYWSSTQGYIFFWNA